jgi:class 3 adenylate cyclase/tetratricopeptide (TPR) repeat protein
VTPSGEARKTVTVVFCDVTGSTALGEQLDPESLRSVIQQYFVEMRAVVERHGGIVEKFIGDAVMAVFGVPRVHEDDALRAVRAAADMQGALSAANAGFERDFGVRIEARIGVNTGEVIAGDPSSEQSFVSGDAVNVAARLEQAAPPGDVLLGDTTYRLVRAAVIAEQLPPLSVKGKSEPLVAYRLVVVEAAGQMLPRRFDVPLVGRDAELRTLLDAFDEVVGGPACRIVTLIGDAGLGKSRLAHELSTLVGDSARVLRGRCLPYGEGITFYPLTEILQDAAAIQADDPSDVARSKIAALLPAAEAGLADRLAALLGVAGTSGSIQETFLATRRLLETLAAESPVVAIFDDIQWAEETFLDLIQYLVGFVVDRPLLIICLARPQLLEERSDWTELGPTVRLHPIDPRSSEVLVANLLGDVDSTRGIAETIVRSAAGNPLFVEEMLRMLVDEGVLSRRGSGWMVTGDVSALAAPETVQAVIAARLDRLPPEEQTLLQHAAVVGEVFWWGAVGALLDQASPVEVGRRLQSLVRKDLIRPDPSKSFSEDAYRFGHLLIRDVAYDALPKKMRADLHERFARWVIERAAERSSEYEEIVGFHLEAALRYLREVAPRDERVVRIGVEAAEKLASAGRRSADRGDMPAALSLLYRARDLLPSDDLRLPELLLDLGVALTDAGRYPEGEAVCLESAELARTMDLPGIEWRGVIQAQWLRLHVGGGTHEEMFPLANRALAELERIGDERGLAQTSAFVADLHFWAGRLSESMTAHRRAVEHAKRASFRSMELYSAASTCGCMAQGLTPARDVIAEVGSMIEEYGDNRLFWLRMGRILALMYAISGDFDRARRLAADGAAAAREFGMEGTLASGSLRDIASIALLAGDVHEAERCLREGAEILLRLGDRGHLDTVAPDLAWVLLSTPGREEEAAAALELAKPIPDDADAVVRVRATTAVLRAHQGQPAEAEALARDAVERAWRTEYVDLRTLSLEALAKVLILAGRNAEAAEVLERAIAVYEAKGNVVAAETGRHAVARLGSAVDAPD